MNNKLVEMVFILDKSGSMSGLEKDTIGGFNSMIEKQKKVEGSALVSTVLFNHEFEVLHNRLDLSDLSPITEEDYYVSGTTALLDAVGRSIDKIKNVHRKIKEEERPSKVIFIITTDGMENSSQEYSYDDLNKMITKQKEENNWEFIFMGANIDASDIGSRVGINKDRTVNYHADKEGIALNYEAISNALHSYRNESTINEKWKEKINKDFKERNNK